VTILLESDDVAAALAERETLERQYFDPIRYRNSPQWREFLTAWTNKGIQWAYRMFDEDHDAEIVL
jgi:hypothetical protein